MTGAAVRVLVCDDDPMVRRLLERLLRDLGLTNTRCIADPALLESEVRAFDPQVVLVDRHMGGLDGMDALQLLAAAPGHDRRAVCLITGDDRPEVRIEALARGAAGVLFKPFDQAALRAQVERLLRRNARGADDALPQPRASRSFVTQPAQLPDAGSTDRSPMADLPENAATRADLLARVHALETANAALRAAADAKNEFVSRASHELRTPLASVLGFAELLSDGQLDEQSHTWATLVLKAGRHLVALVNDLLDVSRIESGELYLCLEPVSASAVCTDVAALIRPVAEAAGLELTTDLGDERDAHVLADDQRLRQVVINLLSNAVKYNRPGGQIRLAVSSPTDDVVRIDVRDTGAGLSPEHLSRLFVAFERLDAARTNIEGTGLGLALSRSLAEHMHGTLTVSSTVGVGSVFTVALRRVLPPAPSGGRAPSDDRLTFRHVSLPRELSAQ